VDDARLVMLIARHQAQKGGMAAEKLPEDLEGYLKARMCAPSSCPSARPAAAEE